MASPYTWMGDPIYAIRLVPCDTSKTWRTVKTSFDYTPYYLVVAERHLGNLGSEQ